MSKRIPTRRKFLKAAAAAGATTVTAPTIIPSSALGADGAVAPSNRVTIGIIGVGDHDTNVDLKELLYQKDAQIVALCDVDLKNVERAK